MLCPLSLAREVFAVIHMERDRTGATSPVPQPVAKKISVNVRSLP